MSSLQNNPSNVLFPTETIISMNQDYNSLTFRKSLIQNRDDAKSISAYSSILYKTKQNSKQRLVSPQLQSIINKIQVFVDDVDNKIQNRVQLVKQVYLNEYKEQVLQMSTQLKNLRQKLDNEVMKERANEKMFYLEEQRDFFRHQVIKLNQQMNKLNEQNKLLKKQLQEDKREVENYKKIVYNLESKLLKMKSINIQRNKMLQTVTNLNAQRNKQAPSTIDTKQVSGSKTQRSHQKPLKSLSSIQDEDEQRQMSRTGYRLKASQSVKAYSKLPANQRQIMRSTATVTYPKLTVQRLDKIQGYSELLQRQRIVDECINELKRQIYYRNLSIGQKQSRLHFNEASQIKFQSFTKTDKRQLIVKILSNQNILNEFYQFLFNSNNLGGINNKNPDAQMGATTELINSKLDLNNTMTGNKWSLKKLKFTDPKFNTQMLNNLKTEFNKKIFDIKHNR